MPAELPGHPGCTWTRASSVSPDCGVSKQGSGSGLSQPGELRLGQLQSAPSLRAATANVPLGTGTSQARALRPTSPSRHRWPLSQGTKEKGEWMEKTGVSGMA